MSPKIAKISGPDHARYLINKGRPELCAQLTSWLYCTAAEVVEDLNADSYGRLLSIITDERLWDQLKVFATQDLPLKDCKGASELHAPIQQHLSAMFMNNAWMSSSSTEYLSGQAWAHPDTAEVYIHAYAHLCTHV